MSRRRVRARRRAANPDSRQPARAGSRAGYQRPPHPLSRRFPATAITRS